MKYKIGDIVQIKSKAWYNSSKKGFYGNIGIFIPAMKIYCGKKATITHIIKESYYKLDIDNNLYLWSDSMFEEPIENMKTKEIILPEGWEVDKIENDKIILKESNKELPKTWEECYKELHTREYITINGEIKKLEVLVSPNKTTQDILPIGLGKSMLALCKLLVCREIYRKGWKPNWTNGSVKYYIMLEGGKINIGATQYLNRILSFQSSEIRNKFLENFKDLIEEAKELI